MIRAAAVAAVAVAACAVAPAAQAVTLRGVSARPDDPTAGALTTFRVGFATAGAAGGLRTATLRLPAGLVIDPLGAARCPLATFRSGATCDASTRAGFATAAGTAPARFEAPGDAFRLEPERGQALRLGIALPGVLPAAGTLRLEAAVTARPDGGVDATFAIPTAQDGAAFTVDGLGLALAGTELPPSCTRAATVIAVRDGAAQATAATTGFTPTGCSAGIDPSAARLGDGAGGPATSVVAAVHGLRRGKPSLVLRVTPPARTWTREIAIALPAGLVLDRRRALRGVRVRVGGRRVRAQLRADADGLVAGGLPARRGAVVEVRVPSAALRAGPATRRRRAVRLGVGLRDGDGGRRERSVSAAAVR